MWAERRGFRKICETTISLVMPACGSVYPHGTTRLLLNGFSCNPLRIFQKYVSKVWRVAALHMKTDVRLRLYLAEFFLEKEMYEQNAVEKIKPHIL